MIYPEDIISAAFIKYREECKRKSVKQERFDDTVEIKEKLQSIFPKVPVEIHEHPMFDMLGISINIPRLYFRKLLPVMSKSDSIEMTPRLSGELSFSVTVRNAYESFEEMQLRRIE